MSYSLIVAFEESGGIGKNGKIPWNLPDDLRYFKIITLSKSILMGRRTWDSLPLHPLDGRENIVLTSGDKDDEDLIGSTVYNNINDAFDYLAESNGVVIGGESLYRFAMNDPRCQTLYITAVYADYECDVYFPRELLSHFHVEETRHSVRGGIPHDFIVYSRT